MTQTSPTKNKNAAPPAAPSQADIEYQKLLADAKKEGMTTETDLTEGVKGIWKLQVGAILSARVLGIHPGAIPREGKKEPSAAVKRLWVVEALHPTVASEEVLDDMGNPKMVVDPTTGEEKKEYRDIKIAAGDRIYVNATYDLKPVLERSAPTRGKILVRVKGKTKLDNGHSKWEMEITSAVPATTTTTSQRDGKDAHDDDIPF